VAAIILAGCTSSPPAVEPGRDAIAAIGGLPGEALRLQIESQPDDVAGPIDTLDLPAVLEKTARNSPAIQVSLARVRQAQAEAQQARLLPNPVLDLALRFPKSGATIIDVGVSADVLAILRKPGSISLADSKLRAAGAEAITSVLDELTLAQTHYIAAQSLEASCAVLRERRELIDRLLSLAESRLRIGEGNRLDVVTLQTQRVELEAEIADRELELRDERLSLARLIGQPSDEATWKLPAWAAPSEIHLDERRCIDIAMERRPEIQQRRWEFEAFGVERQLAAWGTLDGLTAGVAAEKDGDWSVGPAITVPIPLLDMGQAQRDKALAALVEARHQLTLSRRMVIEETRRAFGTLKGNRQNLQRVRDQLIPLQEDRLKQAEAQFRAGQSDITSLLIAEQDLRSSRSQLIDLQHKTALAQLRLERAVGGSAFLANATTQPTSSK
jgi:outer membrane protein TolC